MKEIIVDSHIFTHNKCDILYRYDGTGNKKTDEQIINSSLIFDKENLIKSEGKVKIKSNLDLNNYIKFLDETYDSLKFLRKLEENNSVPTAAIYPYIFNSSLKDESEVKSLSERAQRERLMRNSVGPSRDNHGLSDINSNKSLFNIFHKNNELFFKKANTLDQNPTLRAGNLDIELIEGKNISHINIKKLPFVIKKDLNLHSGLNKKTLTKELLDAQIHYVYKYLCQLNSLTLTCDFSKMSPYWIENDSDFKNYIKSGAKLIPKIQEIHGGGFYPAFYFIAELNYRMTIDSINASHQLMEVYIKSADLIRDKKNLPEEVLKNLDNYKKEHKTIEELIPKFPITFLIQNSRLNNIKKIFPHLFDNGKVGLSFFD